MKRYVERPRLRREVHAVQFQEGMETRCWGRWDKASGVLVLPNNDVAHFGDWLVKSPSGQLFRMTPKEFAAEFEPAPGPSLVEDLDFTIGGGPGLSPEETVQPGDPRYDELIQRRTEIAAERGECWCSDERYEKTLACLGTCAPALLRKERKR